MNDTNKTIKMLNYTRQHCGMPDQGDIWTPNAETIALDKAIKAVETLEKIKEIIREEEHYMVSGVHPNQDDYNVVAADKFKRIWKLVSEVENK